MENKPTVEPPERKESVVYELGADGVCEFEDGESIRVSRTMLAFHSKFFTEAFFGQEPKTRIKIDGFDRASFKTFLDCLFGMRKYTTLDALLIYPIAHRYEVTESLVKCSAVLKPKHMNENVPLVLNLVSFYKCNELINHVVHFIYTEYGIINFLESKKYYSLLEPSAILTLIGTVDLNSLVWTLVCQWGDYYLKQRNKTDIRSLLMENGIFGMLSLFHFESAKAIVDFHGMTKKQLLHPEDILYHLEANTMEFNKKLPDRSVYLKINSGYSFSETIVLKRSIFVGHGTVIIIQLNKSLVEPEYSVSNVLEVRARYICREVTQNSSNPGAPEIWRSDLNFFYRESLQCPGAQYLFSSFFPSDQFRLDVIDGDCSKPLYQLSIRSPGPWLEVHSVEFTYYFKYPCRILKTSLNTSKNVADDDKLHFARRVAVREMKEK